MAEDVVERLRPCPFCGCEMNRVKHSAFHRTDSTLPASCWLATAVEFGGPYELDEIDYPAWNRRSPFPDAEAARREAIEAAAKVADAYAARMHTSAEKPHPITGRENIIAICKADAGESLAKAIRALSPPVEGEKP